MFSPAFSSIGDSRQDSKRNRRGDQVSKFPKPSIRVPSPGGEGQGEGGPILTAFKLS
jgi:hypothetical protein